MTTKRWPANFDHCPACDRPAPLSAKREGRYEFPEALCRPCRNEAIREGEMTSFDHAYERAIANGWAD